MAMTHDLKGIGVLVIACGNKSKLEETYASDVQLISKWADKFWSYIISNTSDLIQNIEKHKPQVLYLLSYFDSSASICDTSDEAVQLGYLMQRSEQMGVRLLIIGTENNPDNLKGGIVHSNSTSLMIITERNRHFSNFMESLITKMAQNHHFASAFVDLAPQHHSAQIGRPLPGSIAICPNVAGKGLVLWSEPQP